MSMYRAKPPEHVVKSIKWHRRDIFVALIIHHWIIVIYFAPARPTPLQAPPTKPPLQSTLTGSSIWDIPPAPVPGMPMLYSDELCITVLSEPSLKHEPDSSDRIPDLLCHTTFPLLPATRPSPTTTRPPTTTTRLHPEDFVLHPPSGWWGEEA